MIQRRLYIYIVAAASFAMVLIGLINLGSTALNQLLNATPPYSNVRDAYAGFGAVILVGLPVWGIHWWLAQRFAARTADERASAIRRLYLYVVLAATGIALAIYLRRLIEDAAGVVLGSSSDGASITRALALFGASQLLYYILARLLGIEHPGGVSTNILVALASPVATVIIFGLAWLWIQRQLAADAGGAEATRQAGVRHLYTNLVAFL